MKKLLASVLAFMIVVGTIQISAPKTVAAAEKVPADYIEIENVEDAEAVIGYSYEDVIGKIESGISAFSPSGKSFTVKEPGMLVIRIHTTGYQRFKVFADSAKTIPIIEENLNGNVSKYYYRPVDAGTYYFDKLNEEDAAYIGYVPFSNELNITKYRKNSDGAIGIIIEAKDKYITELEGSAVTGEKIAKQVWIDSVWNSGQYAVEKSDDGWKIDVPQNDVYTLMLHTTANESEAYFVVRIETSKLKLVSLGKMKEPYSYIADTNVVVGMAEAKATVYLSYKGVKYTAKANKSGIYVITVPMLEKGEKIKIWQKKSGITSSKRELTIAELPNN